ncbi:MAG: hypothetical protein ACRED5_18585 [Propylenella sp.]
MAAVQTPPGLEALAASYYAGGYAGVDDFLAAIRDLDLKVFDANGKSEDGRPVARSSKESREAKRGLLFWLMESLGRRSIDYFEFGVMNCRTFGRVIEWTLDRDARFYGFDTFEGLPEPWVRQGAQASLGVRRPAGDLKAAHPPAVYDARATLFKGLFQDTLPGALELAFPAGRRDDRQLFVNIDCDLYSGALYVLAGMHALLRSGDYVYFDEFFDAMNEFSAFNDYIRSHGTKGWFTPVARAYDGMLFRIDLPPQPEVEVVTRRSTSYLTRLQSYLRARISLRKNRAVGFDRKNAPPG